MLLNLVLLHGHKTRHSHKWQGVCLVVLGSFRRSGSAQPLELAEERSERPKLFPYQQWESALWGLFSSWLLVLLGLSGEKGIATEVLFVLHRSLWL